MPSLNSKESCALVINQLPAFDAASWSGVVEAFAAAQTLALGQQWQDAPSRRFRPGQVKLGWRGAELFFFAQLEDDDIFSYGRRDGELLCELGDVFEVFARDVTVDSYIELHTAPTGLATCLRWPSRDQFKVFARTKPLDHRPYLNARDPFRPRVQIEQKSWSVFAAVALGSDPRVDLVLREWLVSFGRYDASRDGAETVLSSTSPHAVADFHRQEEWTRVRFVD